MDIGELAARSLAWFHILLFVVWLGGDIGVFWLGQNFRRRQIYSLNERVVILKMLVAIDMAPRTAWALMVPSSITLLAVGGWLAVPFWGVILSWLVGLAWLILVWDSHRHDGTPRARTNRDIENFFKWGLMFFYTGLGLFSLNTGGPLPTPWLAWKATGFGAIFLAAIMTDVSFKPVGPMLMKLLKEGSSDALEGPLRQTMDRTRLWVFAIYALLIAVSWIGTVKPDL